MTHTKKNILLPILAILLTCLYVIGCVLVHMNQLGYFPHKFLPTDFPTHIYLSLEGWVPYSGLFLVFRIIFIIFGDFGGYASIAFFTLLDLSSVILCWLILTHDSEIKLNKSLLLIASTLINVISGFSIPLFGNRYITGNMWGNITYSGMKPFAICTLFFFFLIRKNNYSEKFWKLFIFFTIALTISTGIKPSFTISFMPVIAFLVIMDCNKKRVKFYKVCVLASAFIPSLYLMYKQYRILFQQTGAGKTAINVGYTFKLMSNVYPLMLILSFIFPLIFCALNYKTTKAFPMKTTLFLWGISFIVALLFIENGARINHGNYLWGLFFSTFYWFYESERQLLISISQCKENKTKYDYKIIIPLVIFIICVGFGIYSFTADIFGGIDMDFDIIERVQIFSYLWK